jgi:ATP phosphoribosyltransferase regulatory subunit HisZ
LAPPLQLTAADLDHLIRRALRVHIDRKRVIEAIEEEESAELVARHERGHAALVDAVAGEEEEEEAAALTAEEEEEEDEA